MSLAQGIECGFAARAMETDSDHELEVAGETCSDLELDVGARASDSLFSGAPVLMCDIPLPACRVVHVAAQPPANTFTLGELLLAQ